MSASVPWNLTDAVEVVFIVEEADVSERAL